MPSANVKQLQADFGDSDWNTFLQLSPEWMKDLDGKSKTDIKQILQDGFSDTKANRYADQVAKFFATTSSKTSVQPPALKDLLKNEHGIALGTPLSSQYPNILEGKEEDGSRVVVKVLTDAREASRLGQIARLSLPNSVQYRVIDISEGESHGVAVMPFYPKTVESVGGSLSTEQIDTGVRRIITALEKLHDAGFVHLDVKASNVFLNETGDWVLGDFGSVTKIGGSPTSCTDRYIPQGTAVEAQPHIDFEMLKTMMALLASASKEGAALKAADKDLGYRPSAELRDDLLRRSEPLAKVEEKIGATKTES